MNIQGIELIFYWVTDLDRSLEFYSGALGIEAGPRFDNWQEMNVAGPVRFGLHAGGTEHERVNAVMSLLVPNLDDAMAQLDDKGHTPVRPATEIGPSRFATYQDPDGNLVDLLERL